MKIRSLIACLACALTSYAQTGNYFLSHFSPDQERSNIVCFDQVQDDRGVFYFATQAGILQFDGINWDQIPTNSAIYSIERTSAGDIFAAGSKGFGKIVRNENGLEVYQPLYDQPDIEYIFQIVVAQERVYFLSDHLLYEYNTLTSKTTPIEAEPDHGAFLSLSAIGSRLILSTASTYPVELKGQSFAPATLPIAEESAILFTSRYQDQYLVGTDDNKLYLASMDGKFQPLILEDAEYAEASVIVNASWVNNELIAIGTLRGGVLFVNPVTGSTQEIINYSTGLPDNEIFSILTDQNLNVWVAHTYGFTRISPFLPLRSFRYYAGLTGNLLCATTYQGRTYVGTSLGLYALEEQESYEDITYYVDVPVRTTVPGKKSTVQEPQQKIQEEPTKETQKGGLFRFLRKKKNTPKEETASTAVTAVEETPKEIITTRREKRTKRILRSSVFAYKKVSGIDAKVSQLTHWHGRLIAAGSGGAYEVDAYASTTITQNPIRFLFASEKLSDIILATYDDKLHRMRLTNNWIDAGVLDSVPGPVQYIFAEDTVATWFCGFDKIYRMTNSTGQIQRLEILNQSFDKTIGTFVNNQVIIASPDGFFFYNTKSQKLERGDTLRKPVAYYAEGSSLWFRDQHNWYQAGMDAGQPNLQLLNLFSSLRFVGTDSGNQGLWLITGSNELFHLTSNAIKRTETLYPLILKSIQNNSVIVARNFLRVDQNQSSVVVEVVKPDYIANRFVEYRYFLEGVHTQWSDWSTSNNVIKFPYLPSGNYTLQVESRDIFGRVLSLEPVKLSVEPPYWKQTWFYAAEFGVFAFLVLVSFRLSYRFIFLSRILSLLSIIMFIEFIQTAAGEQFSTKSSPVIDFGVQVCVALMILPVEGFLRRHLLQALARRNEARMREMQSKPQNEVDAMENPKD